MKKLNIILTILLINFLIGNQTHAQLPPKNNPPSKSLHTQYRKTKIGEIEIFYREAGDPKKPTILLLHGFPSSITHVPGPDRIAGSALPLNRP
jgi:hypothetical protein